MYTKGTKQNPIITKIVKMNVDVYADYDIDTDLDVIRSFIYGAEKSNKNAVESLKGDYEEGFFSTITRENVQSFSEYTRRQEGSRSRENSQNDADNDGRGTVGESVSRYSLS